MIIFDCYVSGKDVVFLEVRGDEFFQFAQRHSCSADQVWHALHKAQVNIGTGFIQAFWNFAAQLIRHSSLALANFDDTDCYLLRISERLWTCFVGTLL
ncbi:hypothetical protein MKW98_014608 [Papaver atlanticum]|uniref:Uncharacterized protein n=1 Tax=Papaver atlanticum TaxID=357466 RepID=A0AAD4XDR4_9MAGN|nr:hypothetical protein MKW98_014608 [Papaver atlanticum]